MTNGGCMLAYAILAVCFTSLISSLSDVGLNSTYVHAHDSKVLDQHIADNETDMAVVRYVSEQGAYAIECKTIYDAADIKHKSPSLSCERSHKFKSSDAWLEIIVNKGNADNYNLSYPYSAVYPKKEGMLDMKTTAILLDKALAEMAGGFKDFNHSVLVNKTAESFGISVNS